MIDKNRQYMPDLDRPMEILTVEEISERLKISTRTVSRLRDKGLPSFNVGGSIRFDWAKVLEWINEQPANSTQGAIEEDEI